MEWVEGRGLSLRVKRGEKVGVRWLDGVDVSVMAWCQTLCHRQCQPRQPIPQWSATVQFVSKINERTGRTIPCGDERLETEPTQPPQDADGLLNDTHLMFQHPPFLVDAHKWCDNKVETRDVHAALTPLHGSQRRTQIVASVSKVAWMRVR